MTRRFFSVVLVSAMALAGCSDDGAASSPTDPTTPTTTIALATTTTVLSTEAIEAFHQCLGDAGMEVEPIPFDAQGRPRLDLVMVGFDLSDPEASAVVAGCSEHLSTGALDMTNSPLIDHGVNALLVEFSECVRSRGVSGFPDPLPGFIGIGGPYPVAEIPFSDPDLESAIDECRRRLSTATN